MDKRDLRQESGDPEDQGRGKAFSERERRDKLKPLIFPHGKRKKKKRGMKKRGEKVKREYQYCQKQ